MIPWQEASKKVSVSVDFLQRCVNLGIIPGDETGVEGSFFTKPWLKLTDISVLLGLSDRTVRRYVKKGIIPAHRFHSRLQFLPSDIEQVINDAKI